MDSHIHLQDFKTVNATEIILQAEALKVDKFICVSVSEDDWAKVLALFKSFPEKIIPALGIHPWYIQSVRSGWEKRLREQLTLFPEAVVGECGLDSAKGRNIDEQKPFFEKQIEIAEELGRPLLIHAVQAVKITEERLKNLSVPFVWHSFSASAETAGIITNRGGFIGINAGFFRKKNWQEVLKKIPPEKILIESDAPYQYSLESLPEVCARLSDFYQMEISERIYKNSQEFVHGKK